MNYYELKSGQLVSPARLLAWLEKDYLTNYTRKPKPPATPAELANQEENSRKQKLVGDYWAEEKYKSNATSKGLTLLTEAQRQEALEIIAKESPSALVKPAFERKVTHMQQGIRSLKELLARVV